MAVPVGRRDLERIGFAEAEADAPAVELDGDGIAERRDLDDAQAGAGEEPHGEEALGERRAARHAGDLAGAVEAEVLQGGHGRAFPTRSEEHTSELQSLAYLVC